MGCGNSKPGSKEKQIKTPRDIVIENRLSPMLNPTHDLNINKKYTYLIKIIPNEFTGDGIRKTPKYISLVLIKELEEKRNEFWGFLNRFPSGRSTGVLGSFEISCLFSR